MNILKIGKIYENFELIKLEKPIPKSLKITDFGSVKTIRRSRKTELHLRILSFLFYSTTKLVTRSKNFIKNLKKAWGRSEGGAIRVKFVCPLSTKWWGNFNLEVYGSWGWKIDHFLRTSLMHDLLTDLSRYFLPCLLFQKLPCSLK